MHLPKQESQDSGDHAGPKKAELSANNDNEKHDRYRSWVVLFIWILEKILKKGG